MIAVTRLDGTQIVVNIDVIQWIEQTPDTLLALTTGERLLVREPVPEVVRRAVEFKREIAAGPVVRPREDQDSVGG